MHIASGVGLVPRWDYRACMSTYADLKANAMHAGKPSAKCAPDRRPAEKCMQSTWPVLCTASLAASSLSNLYPPAPWGPGDQQQH